MHRESAYEILTKKIEKAQSKENQEKLKEDEKREYKVSVKKELSLME